MFHVTGVVAAPAAIGEMIPGTTAASVPRRRASAAKSTAERCARERSREDPMYWRCSDVLCMRGFPCALEVHGTASASSTRQDHRHPYSHQGANPCAIRQTWSG